MSFLFKNGSGSRAFVIGILLTLGISLMSSCSNEPRKCENRKECYSASMKLVADHRWKEHDDFMAEQELIGDSILELHAFCSDMAQGRYQLALDKLDRLKAKKAFPCIDSLAAEYHWDVTTNSELPHYDPLVSINYLLQVMRNYGNPCFIVSRKTVDSQ